MTDDIWKGKWKQLRGKIQETWGTLTDDELDELEGQRDQTIGKIQERTGKARAEVEAEIKKLESSLAD